MNPAHLGLLAALVLAFPAGLAAQGVEEGVFQLRGTGYAITVNEDAPEYQLKRGEEVLFTAPVMERIGTFTLSGASIAALDVASGISGCSYPALLVQDDAGDARIVELPDECRPFEVWEERPQLKISYQPSIGLEAPVYGWTPVGGLVFERMQAFSPRPATGWADILASLPQHPDGLFELAEIYLGVRELVQPANFASFTRAMEVASAPRREGNLIVAAGCHRHACEAGSARMVLDVQAQTIYAEMTHSGEVEAWPEPRAEWPAPVRDLMDRQTD